MKNSEGFIWIGQLEGFEPALKLLTLPSMVKVNQNQKTVVSMLILV